MELIREINEQVRLTQLKSSFNYPEPKKLKAYLQKQFDGAVSLAWTGKRTVTVILPRYDIPEIIDDAANRALRAFGLEYEELTPGNPDAGGQTNKFSIYHPELKRSEPIISQRELKKERKRKVTDLLNVKQDRKRRRQQPRFA